MISDQHTYGEMIELERSAALDDILSRWHQWQQSDTVGRGYNRRSLVAGDYRVSRQYDDSNGALDGDLENSRMKDVDFQVREMSDPYRSAVYANARALAVGASVWTSPRLPQDPGEKRLVVAAARNILTARLISAGVL